jgi:azurin
MTANSITRRSFTRLALGVPLALTACGTRQTNQSPRGPAVDLQVKSNGDLLEFTPRELSCHAGDQVRLTFRHTGKYVNFEHNWVLILPGSFDAITAAATAAGETKGWLPAGDPRMLAFTPMCGRGQVAVTEFTAPKAGDYLYICTFPGHAQSMWGVLHVLPATAGSMSAT